MLNKSNQQYVRKTEISLSQMKQTSITGNAGKMRTTGPGLTFSREMRVNGSLHTHTHTHTHTRILEAYGDSSKLSYPQKNIYKEIKHLICLKVVYCIVPMVVNMFWKRLYTYIFTEGH